MFRDETKNLVDTLYYSAGSYPEEPFTLKVGQMMYLEQVDPLPISITPTQAGTYVAFFCIVHSDSVLKNGEYAISMANISQIQIVDKRTRESWRLNPPNTVRGILGSDLAICEWLGCKILKIRIR